MDQITLRHEYFLNVTMITNMLAYLMTVVQHLHVVCC